MTGATGRPRIGYPSVKLAAAVKRVIGWDYSSEAALVGAGYLGRALLRHSGFSEQNLSIVVAFDTDRERIGQTVANVKIESAAKIAKIVREREIKLAILCVPAGAAQQCADALVEGGVRGILNFTSAVLSVPVAVTVQNVDLAQSLAVLSHSIKV